MRFSTLSIACCLATAVVVFDQSIPTHAGFLDVLNIFGSSEDRNISSGGAAFSMYPSQANKEDFSLGNDEEVVDDAEEEVEDDENGRVGNLRERLFIDITLPSEEVVSGRESLLKSYSKRAKLVNQQLREEKLSTNRTRTRDQVKKKGPAREMNKPRRPRATLYNGERLRNDAGVGVNTGSTSTSHTGPMNTPSSPGTAEGLLKKAINFFSTKKDTADSTGAKPNSGSNSHDVTSSLNDTKPKPANHPSRQYVRGTPRHSIDILNMPKKIWEKVYEMDYNKTFWNQSQTQRRLDGGVSDFVYHLLRTYGAKSVNPHYSGLNDTIRNRKLYPLAFTSRPIPWDTILAKRKLQKQQQNTVETVPLKKELELSDDLKALSLEEKMKLVSEKAKITSQIDDSLEELSQNRARNRELEESEDEVEAVLKVQSQDQFEVNLSKSSKPSSMKGQDTKGKDLKKIITPEMRKVIGEKTLSDIVNAISSSIQREAMLSEDDDTDTGLETGAETEEIINAVKAALHSVAKKKEQRALNRLEL